MADTEVKDTKVAASPEKKVVEEEKKVVQEVDEDSKTSENGEATETTENGSSEEKEAEEKEVESTENGEKDSTDAPADSCCIKRKSTTLNDAAEDNASDGASPEKKSRIEEKCAETESNGNAEATA